MARIQPLPKDVVHLIAAGEVIDSLAAVVRELAENAIDAGATRITVSLWTEQWRVRVADNGAGMGLANLRQAALPHSTSKIFSSADLWRIASLGFRGEALHSLAQLSRLEICSRESDASDGWRVCYDQQGQVSHVDMVAIAPGTVVSVDDLFANWLARRAALPALAQQLRAVQLVIQHLALCHPQITWQVEQHDRPWFTLYPSTSAKQMLPQILRDVQANDLQEITIQPTQATPNLLDSRDSKEITDPSLCATSSTLYLLVGLPDRCHRRRPDWINIAVNGRCVHLPELEQTITASFRRTLPRDRYPVCFLHLQADPRQIDWNRHPAKTEIYLHDLIHWQRWVAEGIERILGTHLATNNQRVTHLLKAAETSAGYQVNRQILPTSPSAATIENLEQPSAPCPSLSAAQPLPSIAHTQSTLQALAQVHNRYILAEHPTGMWLIEQHIAHERVLYEQLCDRWQLVTLATPIILSHLSSAQLEQLQRLALDVEPFGEDLWAVRTAPELLAQRSDCPAALLELSQGGDLDTALVATACRSAIRNGTPLTLVEMQTLLNQWQSTRNPRTCPHGRPIYLALEETALARFFRRHWVIGKSHGI
jgi:DNA mismatch repair protein MutL